MDLSINLGLRLLICAGLALICMLGAALVLAWWLLSRTRTQAERTLDTAPPRREAPPSPRTADMQRPAGPRCPVCGIEMPAESPQGLCPGCLLRVGIEKASAPPPLSPTTAAYSPAYKPQTPQELAAAFPHLEIVELLGQGGMGAVYKARQPHLDRFVALKILPAEAARDPAFAERFAREARALARLSHPNIVGVYDFGQSGGQYYLMMEYVDGVNLRQAMRAGQLGPREALRIVPQLCDALQFAHDEGVVHRDIKPENILLDKRGRVKVADFGLAKILGQSAGPGTLTGTRQAMGTLHYMAPEQIAGAREVDHRADIYSLGVTFYEMLTGELPLGRFPPPSKRAEVDARLDDVVLRTLEREPDERYQHAGDVKTDVESIARAPAPVGGPTPDGIEALRRGLTFWLTPQPGYARWVGAPTLTLVGLYLLGMCVLALLILVPPAELARADPQPTWIMIGTALCGGPTLIGMAFLFLNLFWLLWGRRDGHDSPRTIPTPRPDWPQRWRQRSPALRKSLKSALLLAMIGFGIGFVSFHGGEEKLPNQRTISRFEIGLVQPWFVSVSESPGGFHHSINFLTVSAGFGLMSLLCLQGWIILARSEKRGVPPSGGEPPHEDRSYESEEPPDVPPQYSLWVGVPPLILLGIVVIFCLGQPDDIAMVTAIGGLLVVVLFVVLNLFWFIGSRQPRHRLHRFRLVWAGLWTGLCMVLYVMLWLPGAYGYESDGPFVGLLDQGFWPYRGRSECSVSLRPLNGDRGRPWMYRRLIVTEIIEVWVPGSWENIRERRWNPDDHPSGRTRHTFVVQLEHAGDPMQDGFIQIDLLGDTRELVIDALDGMSWSYRNPSGSSTVSGRTLDYDTALDWMCIGMKKNAHDVPTEEIKLQTRFWMELIQKAAANAQPNPEALEGRKAVGRLDRIVWDMWHARRNDKPPFSSFPWWDHVGSETTSFEPIVPITWVGLPVMVTVWVGGLWLLKRKRERQSAPPAPARIEMPSPSARS
jgi:tRNA A-37 threonylcarbamoyl transferase component Bud32